MENIETGSASRQTTPYPMSVRVTDIDMPFFSMVGFMIKWAIASIPATILLLVIGALFWGLISILSGGLFTTRLSGWKPVRIGNYIYL